MEFQGQRGDPFSAWSVGKYAKRSATIHLCSEDVQINDTHHFNGIIVSDDTANGAVTIIDKGKKIKDALDNTQEATASLRNKVLGVTYPDSPITLYNGTGDSAADLDASDFTKIQLSNNYKGPFDAVHSPFFQLPVRDMNTGADYYGLNANGANADDALIIVTRLQDTYYFEIDGTHLPTPDDAKPFVKERLGNDNYASTEHWIEDQMAKGYVLHLMVWNTGTAQNRGNALEYFTPINMGHVKLEDGTRQAMTFIAKNSEIPSNLKTRLDAAITRRAVVAGEDEFNVELILGGNTAGFGHNNIFIPDGEGGYDANRLVTWNLFPATTISGITNLGFANSTENHCNYRVTIPNIIGYPEHKRCLVQVQSVSVHADNYIAPDPSDRLNPLFLGVEINGIGVQGNFSSFVQVANGSRSGGKVSNTNIVGYCNLETRGLREVSQYNYDESTAFAYGFDNYRSILDDGVLCSSPFGKQIHVRLINLTNKKDLNTNSSNGAFVKTSNDNKDIINNPTHLTLRLLFLDDDELPMR